MHRITMPRQGVLSRLLAHVLCLIAERCFVQPRRAESPAGFRIASSLHDNLFPKLGHAFGKQEKNRRALGVAPRGLGLQASYFLPAFLSLPRTSTPGRT